MITFTDTMKKIWQYLINAGMTQAGAAGLMGNLYAESGLDPVRLEDLCKQRYRERVGKRYTDATYTAFVDDGTISRDEFLRPMGLNYAYGLAQWTFPTRKAGLYDLCKSRRVSIGDLTAQLDYLKTELQNVFPDVWSTLTSTSNIRTASNTVLEKFEMPAGITEAARNTRAGYADEIYAKYASKQQVAPANSTGAVEKVISIAAAEIGYLEKASNANLDSMTGNAGSANYTKYWRDVYPSYQGQPWCACFVSWVLMRAFGLEEARRLLKHWPYVYCPTLAGMTTNKTPKVGSIIIFYRNGQYTHTGIVIAVTATTVTTIEGNTSGDPGIVANGGGVWRKSYQRSTLSSETKYFMPDYKGAAPSGGLNTTVQWSGKVTSNYLNVRTWAGKEFPQIKSYPQLKTGEIIGVCDTVKDAEGEPWYYAKVGGQWYGFVKGKYVKRA